MLQLIHPVGFEKQVQGLGCLFADGILVFLVFFGNRLIEFFEGSLFQLFLEGVLEVDGLGSLGIQQMIDLPLSICVFLGDWYFLVMLLEAFVILRFYFQPTLFFGLAQGSFGDALRRPEIVLLVVQEFELLDKGLLFLGLLSLPLGLLLQYLVLEAVQRCIHLPVTQLFAGLCGLEFELGSEEAGGSGVADFPVFFHIINAITIMANCQ